MLGKCFFIICALSVGCGIVTGNIGELAGAAIDGAGRGVTLSLSMLGMMCLWCGVMEVMREAGAIRILSRVLRPVLSRIFPHAFHNGVGDEEITASVAANMLGIANAATPFALAAMEKMDAENTDPDTATDDMVTLAVLGSSSISLMPTTIITLRRAAGSAAPFSIIVPVWITSFICAASGMLLCRLASAAKKSKAKKTKKNTDRKNEEKGCATAHTLSGRKARAKDDPVLGGVSASAAKVSGGGRSAGI